MTKNNTIAAIATPNTVGSVAMIRLSGDDALLIAGKVFVPFSGAATGRPLASELRGYTAAYGKIVECGSESEAIDDGVLLVFRAPKSYTGENVAEITCHGGTFVARRVLQACLNAGAVLAAPGEFTKRAVMNGKMTLTQAESVLDVINAVSDQYLACANAQKSGSLARRIDEIAERVLGVSAHIAAWLDYPEEGLDSFETASHMGQLTECQLQLSLLAKSYDIARVMREGIVTAIVGKPNAGKSTLMNLLTGRERSIVTDIPGTTRDVVEETVILREAGGAVLRLCDCAGIRETDDVIEQKGIELMRCQIEGSSLILAVFDNSRKLNEDDYALMNLIAKSNAHTVCVINKSDLPQRIDLAVLSTQFKQVVQISAKHPESLSVVAAVIGKVCDVNALDLSAGFVANERQRACVAEAERLLGECIAGLEGGAPLDATGFLLENALEALYRLSGKRASAEIINEVFRSFCVGK
ncbi:MAG: tRNA uridine-5-carboxymethylaminomethyl(34) synthesis GTPase MnmE [Oscillospiraceae bacterium]|nr:tRNA uridine-5-carboxymethylaminomethyl(34) synthesis GTPase MnmE [Oscillospiraceae bacterium]